VAWCFIPVPTFTSIEFYYPDTCVPCHHSMTCPQIADGGNGLQLWKVVENTLNKQLRRANKGWSSRLRVWHGAKNLSK
jgi:hypothetical protein